MARRKQDTLVLFPDLFVSTKKMTDTQFGALMRAVFAYRFEGSVYEGEDLLVDVMFSFVKNQVDRYNETCEINRNNRMKETAMEETEEEIEMQRNATESHETEENTPHTHTHNRTHNHIHNHTHTQKEKIESVADKPPSPTRFIPPTVEQVRQYATDSGYFVDSQRFVDYYTSIGWMVGKAKMKDWKAAVRNWSGKENGSGKAEAKPLWTIGTVL